MQIVSRVVLFFFIAVFLSSCEFKCNLGNKTAENNKPVIKEGAALYNGISLKQHHVKVNKAYLVYENGERVPDDNFVDFKSPVKLLLFIDSGWVSQNGRVSLGASERVMTEAGNEILNEADLFRSFSDGFSEEDAKIITLTTTLRVPKNTPPPSFLTSFRIWDKNGDNFVEGDYKLYSR